MSVGCGTLVELEVAIKALVDVCQTWGAELAKVGAAVEVTEDAKANIAVCVAALISVS